jgi:hypothetical protein
MARKFSTALCLAVLATLASAANLRGLQGMAAGDKMGFAGESFLDSIRPKRLVPCAEPRLLWGATGEEDRQNQARLNSEAVVAGDNRMAFGGESTPHLCRGLDGLLIMASLSCAHHLRRGGPPEPAAWWRGRGD